MMKDPDEQNTPTAELTLATNSLQLFAELIATGALRSCNEPRQVEAQQGSSEGPF